MTSFRSWISTSGKLLSVESDDVVPAYAGPFTFTGTLHSVSLDVSGELIQDPEVELRVRLARQ